MAEMPSRSPTSGAKATTMMVSFNATCERVKSGSPSVRRLHTNTIAVHGAAASRIKPRDIAIELSRRQERREYVANKDPAKERHREGLDEPIDEQSDADTAHVAADLPERAKVDLHQHGMIMTQIKSPTGRLTWATDKSPMV